MFTNRYGNAIREQIQEGKEYEAGFTFLGKPVYYKLIPEFQISGTGQQSKNIASYIPPSNTDQCWIDNSRSFLAVGSGEYPNDNYAFRSLNTPNVNTQQNVWAYEAYIAKTATTCTLNINIGTSSTGFKYFHVFVMYTKR